jgi:hypothetical protein
MTNNSIDRLKHLRRSRSNHFQFGSRKDFEEWADAVRPHLHFNQLLLAKFNSAITLSNLNLYQNADEVNLDAVNDAIGIANEALQLLEVYSVSNSSNQEIPYPEKVTLEWVYKHAPLSFWFSLLAWLAASFGSGAYFANSHFFMDIINFCWD